MSAAKRAYEAHVDREDRIREAAFEMLAALKDSCPALWLLAAAGNEDAARKHRRVYDLIARLDR